MGRFRSGRQTRRKKHSFKKYFDKPLRLLSGLTWQKKVLRILMMKIIFKKYLLNELD